MNTLEEWSKSNNNDNTKTYTKRIMHKVEHGSWAI